MPEENEHPDEVDFGELDGESVEAVVIEVKGTGQMDRLFTDEEHVVIVLDGTADFKSVERVNGRLVKKFAMKANRIFEPTDALAQDVQDFLIEQTDLREGRQTLPLDGEDGEVPAGVDPDTGEVTDLDEKRKGKKD